ncbi:hypothetical protein SARI_00886 [Salmonella enterica subsp. arizonae serovar 62:z4,z23:-]|uniref:Uncharacterized protein n=1 Tax=Salmonella arizonae (strain ATCC BAA-731 / CDC346-86 / RSK2980) TaxID=41514 RepID=A9MLT9_SALAR|nr:hypothetical protein SARI_00886 [Salmonella enterica subsp. arizonae serovar 62:z4,z23:-]
MQNICQLFTLHQTQVHSHRSKTTAFDLCNYRQSCTTQGQIMN